MKKRNVILLIVAGLVLGGYFFVRFSLQTDARRSKTRSGDSAALSRNPDSTIDLRPLFIAKLQQVVKQGSKGLYDLSIDSMDVDVLQSLVVLRKVRLTSDSTVLISLDRSKQAPDDVFKASFDRLTIRGINLDDIVMGKTMDFQEIEITGPDIEVFHRKRSYNQNKNGDSVTLFQKITKEMERIAIGKFIVKKGNFINHNLTRKKTTRLKDIELRFTDILIDSSTQHATDRFLFAKEALLSLQNYIVKTSDNLYICKIGSLSIQAPQQIMTMRNLSLASAYNRQEFQTKSAYQNEMYDCKVPLITFHNVNWWDLMNEQQFLADKIDVSDAVVKIFLDRSLPRPLSKMGNFPNQMLMKIPIQTNVAKVNIRNLDVTYEEYNPKSKQSGSINMDKLNLDISGITNMPGEIKKTRQTIVKGTGRFVKQIPVQATFVFDLLKHKNGSFSSSLVTGASFEGSIFNHIAIPLGLLKIEKGTVSEFRVKVKGDERKASGDLLMLYNDFKVSMYEKEKDEKGLDKKGVIGFLANTFIIKDENPKKNEPPRHPQAEFVRDPQAGYFNLVWKTALTGVLKTVGVNPKLAKRKKE